MITLVFAAMWTFYDLYSYFIIHTIFDLATCMTNLDFTAMWRAREIPSLYIETDDKSKPLINHVAGDDYSVRWKGDCFHIFSQSCGLALGLESSLDLSLAT